MLPLEALRLRLVREREHELLARRSETARRAVDGPQHDVLREASDAARVRKLARLARRAERVRLRRREVVHERLRTGDARARDDCGDRRRARVDDEERRRGERQRSRDQERVRERVTRRGDERLLDPVEHRVEARALRTA